MSPDSVNTASNGGCDHCKRSGTGTTSVCELSMMDGSEGSEPGTEMMTIGLFGTHYVGSYEDDDVEERKGGVLGQSGREGRGRRLGVAGMTRMRCSRAKGGLYGCEGTP